MSILILYFFAIVILSILTCVLHLLSIFRPSLPWALFVAYGCPFMWAGVYKLVNDVLTFAGPILLYLIINFVQDPQEPAYYGNLLSFIYREKRFYILFFFFNSALYPSLIPNHRVYLCRTHAGEFFGALYRHSTVLPYRLQDRHACTLRSPSL